MFITELTASVPHLNHPAYTGEMTLSCAVSSTTPCRVVWYRGEDYYKSAKPTDTVSVFFSAPHTIKSQKDTRNITQRLINILPLPSQDRLH